ncbi:MAG TPA: hypothetical protein VMD30_08800 [Tepidisphaeraceae bacterium]|nr:hypothetical protein [Tepidisphaeraceae bacterium]
MAEQGSQHRNYARLHVLAAAVAIGCVIAGGIWTRHAQGNASIAAAVALLVAGLAGLIGMLLLLPVLQSLEHARRMTGDHQDQLLSSIKERLEQVSVLLTLVTENQLLSDRAKSVAFREKDREAVRRAVHEEIAAGDWEAAMALANDMERTFGYREEAERFRQEINAKRTEIMQKHIAEQTAAVDRFTMAEAWGQAFQEAQRIMAMYPNEERVMRLPQEIEARRQGRKKELLDSWHEAVQRHDVDNSIEILKRLDLYLTPAEAETMQETARGIFKEKLGILRTQFAMAVQDKRWMEAVTLGDQIMTEFPNTRMAQEVREKMEMLRQRVTGGEPAGV